MNTRTIHSAQGGKENVSTNYRLERWIAVVLAMLFLVPFIAEAEEFYVRLIQEKFVAKRVDVELVPAVSASEDILCPLPEDLVDNPIDGEPAADECC